MPDPTFLLLQARLPDDAMAAHEHGCFARTLGVPRSRVRCHDLLSGPPTDDHLEAADLLLVGGSGSFSVLDDLDWLKAFLGFLDDVAVARGLPMFASCFGFQALVLAGGGQVVHDLERSEVGTFEIRLTEAGRADPLLGRCGPAFNAQLGHKDRAIRLPQGVVNLAGSERAPLQAFRVPGTPILATQFHPELDRAANVHRYAAYLAIYPSTDKDDVIDRMRETPQASSLLPGWVDQVRG